MRRKNFKKIGRVYKWGKKNVLVSGFKSSQKKRVLCEFGRARKKKIRQQFLVRVGV